MEIGTEAAIFLFLEYINGIFVEVQSALFDEQRLHILGEGRTGRRGLGRGCLVLFKNTFYTFFYETCKIFISVHFNHVLLLSYTEHYLPRLCSIFLYVFFAFFGGWGTIPLMCQFQSPEKLASREFITRIPT